MAEIEKPLKSSNMAEVVGEWDAKYIAVDQGLLFSIILAANYLGGFFRFGEKYDLRQKLILYFIQTSQACLI